MRAGTQTAFVWRLTAFLGLSAVWLLAFCAPALAHAQFVAAEPSRGAELQQAPEQVRIRFSEPVEAEFSPVEVRGPQGNRVDQDNARVDPEDARVVEADLDDDLPEGTYTVEWRVTSVDGHAINDTYKFSLVAAVTGTTQDSTQTDAEDTVQTESVQSGSQEEAGSSNNVLLYSVGSIGALAVITLAAVAAARIFRRRP